MATLELERVNPYTANEADSSQSSVTNLVEELVSNQIAITENIPTFHYGQLPQNQKVQVEDILKSIQRARLWDDTVNNGEGGLVLPSEEHRETVLEHVIDLLQEGQALQRISIQRMQKNGNHNYNGLAHQIDWTLFANAAVFHDIGEGNPLGDLPRSVIRRKGIEFYNALRPQFAAAEEAFFEEKIVHGIFSDSPHQDEIQQVYTRYGNRQDTDITFQILHILDKLRATVRISICGTQDSKSGRQSGMDSAFGSLRLLMPSLSPESMSELGIYLQGQLVQIPDMPELQDQLQEILEAGQTIDEKPTPIEINPLKRRKHNENK